MSDLESYIYAIPLGKGALLSIVVVMTERTWLPYSIAHHSCLSILRH